MGRKREGLLALLRNKQDSLDWDNFNFLENLLVFCVMRERAVPKESGVAFGITVGGDDNSVCLVFKTDRAKDPLIRDTASPRPDYLILYGNGNTLILTIVEMKGRAPRNREHGIEQIKALKDVLERELSQNLPGRLRSKLTIQGILLTPFGHQVPLPAIARQQKGGFNILPLQYHHKAELFPYVSRENSPAEGSRRTRYQHQPVIGARSFNSIEQILATCALPMRINDSFKERQVVANKNGKGLYINYLVPDTDEYIALKTDNRGATIAFKGRGDEIPANLRDGLRTLGIEDHFAYEIID